MPQSIQVREPVGEGILDRLEAGQDEINATPPLSQLLVQLEAPQEKIMRNPMLKVNRLDIVERDDASLSSPAVVGEDPLGESVVVLRVAEYVRLVEERGSGLPADSRGLLDSKQG
jgi:hypothetical protein